jgi:hypothetical protein
LKKKKIGTNPGREIGGIGIKKEKENMAYAKSCLGWKQNG